jgi:hypothetical protein
MFTAKKCKWFCPIQRQCFRKEQNLDSKNNIYIAEGILKAVLLELRVIGIIARIQYHKQLHILSVDILQAK